MKDRVSPADALTVRNRIDVEGPVCKGVFCKRLRAATEGFIGRVRNRLAFGRLIWQGIHVSLILSVVHAVAIAAARIGSLSSGKAWHTSPKPSQKWDERG
ncbi:hypothetical protein AC482_05125 [miscellaneous Crenarchaeota group-15 archaeon DG-45]|uniref:Transposase DDE domain-containing protein n=1 Tax=miscellaneous Crenarchaeota group-15 archaeon DG-45 TaxID=1685127 RepID=A0A0M0BNH9_9ARCH|nr:MAG: hypothetical protein AC482_05125 [miscellaneous Crenarchaeota group-15 archaeon DG-45]